jgi:hypothetical protein
MEWFLSQSVKFVIGLWNGKIERIQKDSNLGAIAIAKQSVLIEQCFAAFGGSADKVDTSCYRYFPYPELAEEVQNSQIKLSKQVVGLWWFLKTTEKMPAYIEKAYIGNKDLIAYLKAHKN